MKKNPFLFALCAILVIGAAFVVAGKTLVGHWRVAYGNGITGKVVFQKNGTLEATFDGQTWKVGGPYKVEGNKVSIADSSCGLTYWASYSAHWYSDDSLKMTVIEDTCSGRKANADGAVFVRTK